MHVLVCKLVADWFSVWGNVYARNDVDIDIYTWYVDIDIICISIECRIKNECIPICTIYM